MSAEFRYVSDIPHQFLEFELAEQTDAKLEWCKECGMIRITSRESDQRVLNEHHLEGAGAEAWCSPRATLFYP